MSRLCGLLMSADAGYRTSIVTTMLHALQPQTGRQTGQKIAGNAVFGWTGRHMPNSAAVSGTMVVVDGHIYNKAELEIAGADASCTDAELIAALYDCYGFEETVKRINGDFAAALYDARENVLWLGRDRFGIKPLYYVATPELFAFASRPRALFALQGVTKEVNREFTAIFAASHYRYFDNNPDKSPYRDIKQVPAAHMLKIKNSQVLKSKYWHMHDLPDFNLPEKELSEQYRELLINAVTLRMLAAREPAFTLSGGMDSSSVLACSVDAVHKKQHAFSTVYTDRTYDESDDIKSMLDSKVEQWHQVRVDNPNVLETVRRMIAVHDEPVATATWLSHYLLCEKVAQGGFKSLFGGLGGDELNAGEYEYFFYHFADLKKISNNGQLDHEITMWARYHDHPIYKKNHVVAQSALQKLTDPCRPGICLPDQYRMTRYVSALNTDYFDLTGFQPIMDHPFTSYLKNRTYQDMFRETIPCCLRAEDRQCTAFGLDNFVPFFDYRLVEFMFRVPGTMKIREGITKRLLRESMRGVLPEETRTRIKKTGWNAPAHIWFCGRGLEPVQDLVCSRSFRERGIYNHQEVVRILHEHEEIVSQGLPAENHMMFIWQLVNLELWLLSLQGHAYDADEECKGFWACEKTF